MSEALGFDGFLDDTSKVALPAGDYRFWVDHYERSDYQPKEGSKLPPCPMAEVFFSIPYKGEDGREGVASVKYQLKLCTQLAWVARDFFESIGLMKENSGRQQMKWSEIEGKTGICALLENVSNRGNIYNSVDKCYPPSQAPGIVANEGQTLPTDDMEVPFD